HAEYQRRVKINQQERAQIQMTTVSMGLETASGVSHTLASLFTFIPDAKAGAVGPFPTAIADIKVGEALASAATAIGQGLGAAASFTRGLATLAGLQAGHERRWEDFKLQERLARKEIDQINQQIIAAQIRLEIANLELENHDQQLENSQEVLEFMQDKFTNQELYQWMVTQLSRTHQEMYKLAYDVAKTAEKAFQFELGSDSSYLQFNYVDSLRKGLLTGEKLVYDLKRMEVAYLEQNKREFEIQKPISLAAINGAALQELRQTGACTFDLPEVLFDLDFPGQY